MSALQSAVANTLSNNTSRMQPRRENWSMVNALALCARAPAETQTDVNARSAQDERVSANRVRLAGPVPAVRHTRPALQLAQL